MKVRARRFRAARMGRKEGQEGRRPLLPPSRRPTKPTARASRSERPRDRGRAPRRRAGDDAERADDEDEGDEEGVEPTAVSGEDALRADLAASGAELFDDEDDDDQPILAPLSQPGAPAAQGEGGRRRRRTAPPRPRWQRPGRASGRRLQRSSRRAPCGRLPERSDRGERERSSQPRLESAAHGSSASSAVVDGEGGEARDLAAPRPVVRDRQQIMASGQPTGIDVPLGEGEELVGRDLADAAAIVLASFDRNAGPAPIRAVADALIRRGRLQGDPALAVAQAGASMRADNLRRVGRGPARAVPLREQRPRRADRLVARWRAAAARAGRDRRGRAVSRGVAARDACAACRSCPGTRSSSSCCWPSSEPA